MEYSANVGQGRNIRLIREEVGIPLGKSPTRKYANNKIEKCVQEHLRQAGSPILIARTFTAKPEFTTEIFQDYQQC